MIYISIALMAIMLTTNILMFFAMRKLTAMIKRELSQAAGVVQNSAFAVGKDINFNLGQILDRLPARPPTEKHPDDVEYINGK